MKIIKTKECLDNLQLKHEIFRMEREIAELKKIQLNNEMICGHEIVLYLGEDCLMEQTYYCPLCFSYIPTFNMDMVIANSKIIAVDKSAFINRYADDINQADISQIISGYTACLFLSDEDYTVDEFYSNLVTLLEPRYIKKTNIPDSGQKLLLQKSIR